LIVAFPTLRLHDDYFIIATLGFQMILFSLFNNWIGFTQGPLGIGNIPKLSIFGIIFDSNLRFALLTIGSALIAIFLTWRIAASPLGRLLRAIREDEIMVKAMGRNVLKLKLTVFVISGVMAAAAGSLYSHYMSYIDPSSFTIMESILVISMVIVGGAGSRGGPIVGAFALIAFPEIIRFLGLPNAVASNLRQIIYGLLLLIIIIIRPRGLLGRYGFGR
jgi:branched-chain amino acid transport system permease protein